MRILGEKSTLTVSLDGLSTTAAYKLPNKSFYCVSIKDKSRTYYKVHFSSSERAKKLSNTRKKEIELIEVPVVSTENGQSTEILHFYKDICVREYEDMLANIEADEKAFVNRVSSDNGGDDIDPSYFDDEESELAHEEAEFDLSFTRIDEESKIKAQNLLSNLAKFYLDADMIDKNEFLKAKLEIEQESVSGLILQLDMSKEGIRKLMKKIYTDRASVKSYDALAKLQRIVLDINESLSRMIKDSVGDMKDIKERYAEREVLEESNNDKIEGSVVVSGDNPSDIMKYLESNRKKQEQGDDEKENDSINTKNEEDG